MSCLGLCQALQQRCLWGLPPLEMKHTPLCTPLTAINAARLQQHTRPHTCLHHTWQCAVLATQVTTYASSLLAFNVANALCLFLFWCVSPSCCWWTTCDLQEQYEELVFSQPYQGFYQRVMSHQPRPRPPLTCESHVKPPSEMEELQHINEMRRKVAVMSAQMRMQLQQQPTDSPTAMGMHM